MKAEYQLTEAQKFRLSLLINQRDTIQIELKKTYRADRTESNFKYIESLNKNLMLVVTEITEIYALAPIKCLLTKEEYESFKKSSTKY